MPSSPLLVSITNGARNTLAEAAAVALDTVAGEEYGPSTMTFAGSLVVLAAIAGCRRTRSRRPRRRWTACSSIPEVLGSMVEQWLDDRPTLALLGRGTARAAAEMGALTLKEAARFPAESLQTAQFRHGPLELAGPSLAAMVFATEPRTASSTSRWPASWRRRRLRCWSSARTARPRGRGRDGDRAGAGAVSPAVAILPAQLLAWRLANRRGLHPGEFQIAAKVTTRE